MKAGFFRAIDSLITAAWEDPAKVDAILPVVSSKLDGTRAGASSVKRNRRILNVAMEYAVEHKILRAGPLPKGRGAAPKTSSAVGKRAGRGNGRCGRPPARREPRRPVGELLLHTAGPEVGKNWTDDGETDDGEIHEQRGLKGHAGDDTRVVPGHPLTRVLLEHRGGEPEARGPAVPGREG
ncbi:hypothetical protein [Streptomyces canus]|uniref:hypothetical protein n=1 Tax=Streptomyces canus TaxID=58343 RepID=UPI0037232517